MGGSEMKRGMHDIAKSMKIIQELARKLSR